MMCTEYNQQSTHQQIHRHPHHTLPPLPLSVSWLLKLSILIILVTCWGHSHLNCPPCAIWKAALIKKKIKFSSYVRNAKSYMTNKGLLTSYMGKYLRISSYIRKPFLIFDFATVPLWISLYMKKIWFSILSLWGRERGWGGVHMCNCVSVSYVLFRHHLKTAGFWTGKYSGWPLRFSCQYSLASFCDRSISTATISVKYYHSLYEENNGYVVFRDQLDCGEGGGVTTAYTFLQQAFGHIFEDDVNGFPSTLYIRFMPQHSRTVTKYMSPTFFKKKLNLWPAKNTFVPNLCCNDFQYFLLIKWIKIVPVSTYRASTECQQSWNF